MDESLHRVRHPVEQETGDRAPEQSEGRYRNFDAETVLLGLWRNLWITILVLALSLSIGYIYAFHLVDVSYRATATIVLRPDPRDRGAFNPEAVAADVLSPEEINTERSILVSNTNLAEVIRTLDLVDDPEFNPYLSDGAVQLNEEVRSDYFLTATLETLRSAVRAQTVPGTLLLTVTAESQEPAKARDIANAIANAYRTRNILATEDQRRTTSFRLSAQLENLQEQLIEIESQIAGFQFGSTDPVPPAQDMLRLERLGAEENAIRELQRAVIAQLSETNIYQGSPSGGSAILDRAELPLSPYSPRKKLILASSLLIGGFIGFFLSLLREAYSDRVRSAARLEKLVGRPVIQTAVTFTRTRRSGSIRRQFGLDKPSMAAALENIRTIIRLGTNVKGSPTTIAVISGMPEEGKTALAIALAASYADAGSRVLLIDTDLRARVLSELLASGEKVGLVSALSGSNDALGAVIHNQDLNIDVLICECVPANILDLLSSEEFAELVEVARQNYEKVIFDTPPTMAISDARIVSDLADFVLYAAKQDLTRNRHVVETMAQYEAIGQSFDAIVVSNVRPGLLDRARRKLNRGYLARKGKQTVNTTPARQRSRSR